MSTAYIISEIGKLTKDGKHLVFIKYNDESQIIQIQKMDSLMLIGNIGLTGDVISLMSELKIPVTFVSRNGFFNSILEYDTSKNVYLHQKQFEIFNNEKKKTAIAQNIVKGKILNQLSFIQRIKRKLSKEEEKQVQKVISELKKYAAMSKHAKNTETLRGYEGSASKSYFSVFKTNINPEWAVFNKRSRNPPKSNVNAVLSFLYTLLSNRVYNAIRGEGLYTMIGTLHEQEYGRDSLVFDLMEEFRVPICDTVCCTLFNNNILKENDFRQYNSDDEDEKKEEIGIREIGDKENGGVYLTKDGMEKVIRTFEEKLKSQIMYQETKAKQTMEEIIIYQAKAYKRIMNGEAKEYEPFYMK